jgi:23S rRNA (adenine2503-C2)-methyltransferase
MRIARRPPPSPLTVVEERQAGDGTRKLVLRTHDGSAIEAVVIPSPGRVTLCVSSQVGCQLACRFCATGAGGFTRDLRASEIVAQLHHAEAGLPPGERITNVVFMGMGEPLLNLAAVLAAIRELTDPRGLAIAPRRITVSTAGIVPKLRPLLEAGPVNLAVSLHATTDAVRDRLVPLNRRHPLADLLGALRAEPLVSKRRPVLFEYTLLDGVNDTVADAERLPALLRGIPCRLNVIPMNPYPGAPDRGSPPEAIARFTAAAHAGGIRVTLRRHRGTDIAAACGQLATAARRRPAAAPA